MSITKHTPGPWRVESGPYYRAIRVDGEVIADVRQIGRSFNESNARLLAAAPELLAALEMAVQHYDEWASADLSDYLDEARLPWLAPARAAIAKAKGES